MQYVSDVREFLKKLGYTVLITESQKDLIYLWKEWYKGKVDNFHNYYVYNGVTQVCMEKKSLGMPKKACEDWADLILNERVKINVDEHQDLIDGVLKDNKFVTKSNELVEKTFALGTGAFVEYTNPSKKNGVSINYINAEMIFPLRMIDGEVVDVAFASEISPNKYYVNIHTLMSGGKYQIENIIFNSEKDEFSIEELPEGVQRIVKSDVPLFQLVKPNSVNNSDINNSMGLSVFANAIDEAKDVDEKFDSYHNEFKLGKKRIFIDPSLMNSAIVNEKGDVKTSPVFDTNDTTFYAVPFEDSAKEKLKQTDFNLRVQEHSQALQDALSLFGFKVGFFNNFYTFKDGEVYTNTTNIIASNSKMFRRLKKHELIFDSALKNMVIAIIYLNSGTIFNGEITIDFDDSIIEDKEAERKQYMEEIAAGLMNPVEYRMKVYNEDEETAKSKIPVKADVMP